MRAILVFLESIKFQHTVFALPFAVIAYILAARTPPAATGWLVFAKVVAACVFARTAAMGYNRWLDRDIDAANPRTRNRALPAGTLSPRFMLVCTVASAVAFVAVSFSINTVAGTLSPVALGVLLGYSWCKRFTALCHVVLGLALAIAPSGAWIAVKGSLGLVPLLLSLGVLLWTCGFDIIYAAQDIEYDRAAGLHSIPARLGAEGAFGLSAALHGLCLPAFAVAGRLAGLHSWYYVGVALVAVILLIQHVLVRRWRESIPIAFFAVNGWVGIMLLACTLAETGWPH